MLACKVPTKPDRQRKAAYQAFHIGRRFVFPKPDKVMAYFHCHCEVDLVNMFGVFLPYNDMRCDDGAEIEQYQPGPDFLFDVLYLFRMEINGPDRVFKVPE